MSTENILKKIKNTPAFIVDEERLIHNLEILKSVIDECDCHILLAQKCFSMYSSYDLLGKYLSGTTASGIYEARLGKIMNKENHVFSPAYSDKDMDELLEICDHIVFNSFSQWIKHRDKCLAAVKNGNKVSFGLRINPEISTGDKPEIYDPCAKYSRMGIKYDDFVKGVEEYGLEGIEGLHIHTLCEEGYDSLEKVLTGCDKNGDAGDRQVGDIDVKFGFLDRFGEYLKDMKWINLGGGHHITRDDYDVEALKNTIKEIKREYNVEVYMEPGEAVALNAGYMVATVLDIVKNDIDIAILDASAACHMPDILEVPYTPEVFGGDIVKSLEKSENNLKESEDNPEELEYNPEESDGFDNNRKDKQSGRHLYRFAGNTCLAGDVIGDYIMNKPLNIGDRVILKDMAIYSMVKTNTFNGMKLPDIGILRGENVDIIKKFSYEDFKSRL